MSHSYIDCSGAGTGLGILDNDSDGLDAGVWDMLDNDGYG